MGKPDDRALYRSELLTHAQSLQTLAAADDRRAAWVERCGGTPDDAAWHRMRAEQRRRHARELVHQYDEACRLTAAR
jgi:hypothetical protein